MWVLVARTELERAGWALGGELFSRVTLCLGRNVF